MLACTERRPLPFQLPTPLLLLPLGPDLLSSLLNCKLPCPLFHLLFSL